MKAIVLAAGRSSRFHPFGNGFHKTMIPLLGKPILAYTIEGVKKAGIGEIILVVRDDVIKSYFGDGEKFGVKITYVKQTHPLGMGDALLRVRKYIQDDFIILGGNHINSDLLIKEVMSKKKKGIDAVLMVEKRENPWEYGVASLDGDRVLSVVEKPKRGEESSSYCLVSVYYLPCGFVDILSETKRHEYCFEEALNNFVGKRKVLAVETKQEIATLKYPWDLLRVKNYLLKGLKRQIAETAKIHKSAIIQGNVYISPGVEIMEGVVIRGPVYIGRDVYIGNNALLRDGVDVENKARVGSYMEVKNSLIFEDTTTHSGFIGDSAVGRACKIGAGFKTANVRLDRRTIKAEVNGNSLDTQLSSLGAIIGEKVKLGINVSTMPGVIIGNNVTVGPGTVVTENIADDNLYYALFKGVIRKSRKASLKNMVILFDIDRTIFDTEFFKESKLKKFKAFGEVGQVLKELRKVGELGIFSEGDLFLQRAKLEKTQLIKHFPIDKIHITGSKELALEQVLKRYKKKNLVLVDDKLSILHLAKKAYPSIFTIWVKRGKYAIGQELTDFKPDVEVNNLQEIISVLS